MRYKNIEIHNIAELVNGHNGGISWLRFPKSVAEKFEGGDAAGLPTMKEDIKTPQAAYAYMIFNLLCMPCFAAVGAMKRELKTWKMTGAAIGIQMLTAYIVALLVYVIGNVVF